MNDFQPDGPRRSGRTCALLTAAVALAGSHEKVYFVALNAATCRYAREQMYKLFGHDETTDRVRFVPWFRGRSMDGAPAIFDHTVTERLMRFAYE